MNNVISFSNRKKVDEVISENASYFFNFGHFESKARVDFGGAFTRDLIEKLSKCKSEVKKSVETIVSNNYNLLRITEEITGVPFPQIDKARRENELNVIKVNKAIDMIKTPKNLDDMMTDGHEYLFLMPTILSCIIYHSYNEFNLRRMIKQNWLQIDISPEDFSNILNDVYEEW